MIFTKKNALSTIMGLVIGVVCSTIYFNNNEDNQRQTINLLTPQLMVQNKHSTNDAGNSFSSSKIDLDSRDLILLQQQVKQLTTQIIEQDTLIDEMKESAIAHITPEKSKKERWLNSPEYFKSTIIPTLVLPVVEELTSRLALSPAESEGFADLLKAKATADHDSMKPYLDELNKQSKKVYDPERLAYLNELANDQLTENQESYNNQLNNLFDTEQLANYQQLENETTQKNTDRLVNHQTAELTMAISTLDDYQKQQIQQLFQESYNKSQDTPLGASGSIYAKRANAMNSEQLKNHQRSLKQLLTNEQLATYESYQKIK
ncbi:hypothetical protein [Colwellia psychrerythraea]|uniref:Uncharacterized protein n=1 Tax=Colwellia psychrerythraea TaxID=28229 RepID=A0A099KVC0_COLPS|nr:hypothetical protein [Colwellia psychrerythraea]KGJ93822.1 hypothetical protein GAB14E_2377 [Colwellia psychrerythraea]